MMLAVPDTSVVLGRLERDVTGDGRPEVLSLVAVGETVENMSATLTIQSEGRVLVRVSISLPSRRVYDRELRSTLRMSYSAWLRDVGGSFFAAAKFLSPSEFVARLRGSAPKHVSAIAAVIARDGGFAADTARGQDIWRRIQASRATVFEFSRGGDDAGAIAWSSADGRFYRLVECC